MADAAVSFVIERLGDMLVAEVKFLSGVRGQVEGARVKLEAMRRFLKDANAYVRDGKDANNRVRLWFEQIREAAYSFEDVIDTFVLKVYSRRKGGVKNVLKRYACIFIEGYELHKVGSEIERISTSISNLTSSLRELGITELKEDASSSTQERSELRRTYGHVVEKDVVGLDSDMEKLVAELTKEDNRHHVVSIQGMGGLGKTTLARKVYQHARVRKHFDCFAWASISQQFQKRAVWEGILIKLASERREEIRSMGDAEVAEKLYNVLKERKCLVVLDDVWTTTAWDLLKDAFPEAETNSKILLTTRKEKVASYVCKSGLLHKPRFLNDNESWELFKKKYYSSKPDHVTDFLTDDGNMKVAAEEMVKHCAGLPLAIIVLSGLLSTKETIHEWEMVHKNVKTYINEGRLVHDDEKEEQDVSSILSLSYDELPYHLKPCFLYLAHCPEDHEINVKQLCYNWIAEGFIYLDQKTLSSTEVTVEDVAYDCLMELAGRSMIQVETMGSTGRIKSCRIHDLVRDMSLLKAREENFLQFIHLKDRDRFVPDSLSNPATDINAVVQNKVRRLAIYPDCDFTDLIPSIINRYSSLRSIIFVNMSDFDPFKGVKHLFNHFQLLRVLRLENYVSGGRSLIQLPKEIGKLIHLRLLSLRNTRVATIPSSIGNLRCLQTLDLRSSGIGYIRLPNVIWRLEQLRHLYFLTNTYVYNDEHLRLSNDSNLQTLFNVPTKYLDVNAFLKLINLKKLVLSGWNEVSYPTDFRLDGLRSLALHGIRFTAAVDIMPVISCCPQIYKLKVDLPIRLPEEYRLFPRNLTKLSLRITCLEGDAMKTLEKLPNLRVLLFLKESFVVHSKIIFIEGGFRKLESLCFENVDLEEWRIEEKALPSLRHLRISYCWLKVLPDGLRFVTKLEKLDIVSTSKNLKRRLEEGREDFQKVQHVPSLVFRHIQLDAIYRQVYARSPDMGRVDGYVLD